jgi:hypothetical protein
MLRALFTVALTACVLMATHAQADVYKYTDEKGNISYTDKPAVLPAERLDVQSQRTDKVALQARQVEEQERMNSADQARQEAASNRADQRAAEKVTATDKAEQCKKSRERFDSYTTSQRLFEQLPNGERRYLSDAELDAARASAKASMDVLCK